MNIDNLTYGDMKQIAAIVSNNTQQSIGIAERMVGKYVIARCYSAGVHAGTVLEVDGETAVLGNSRRLWSWKANDGIALSGVAQTGIKSDCKVDFVNPEIYLTGVCELIPCSIAAEKSINEA